MKLYSNFFRFDIFIAQCLGGQFSPDTVYIVLVYHMKAV